MTTIKSPAKFTGRTFIGPLILDFKDGVAEHNGELNDGVRLYLEQQGYGIDSAAAEPEAPEPPVDSRDVDVVEGAPLRDAAVDPHPEDFLPPVGAGDGDPHGPHVVAPGIHAANMPKPIHPGPVGTTGTDDDGNTVVVKDTDAQSAKESELAEAVLIDQVDVTDATLAAAAKDPVQTDQPTGDDDGPFDPSRHTVAEVNAYLAEADEAERARVLDAEANGKSRATIAAPAQ